MSDHLALLKSMLHSIISDKHDEATATMHDYLVAKSRQISGIPATPDEELDDEVQADDETVDDETSAAESEPESSKE